jgi:LmbE family N-acetylglucosaminyl deacetylase
MQSMSPTALVVSPHPDDELIPAGGTLMILKDAGWRIVNLACSLGRPEQHERRRGELERACAAAGFELDLLSPPVGLSRDDDLAAAGERLTELVCGRLAAVQPALVLAPGPTDGHHSHEVVARAVARAVTARGVRQPVWWWELWGHLRTATLLVRIDDVLERVCAALAEHGSEVARNDFVRLVRSRAATASILGPERVFGFGRPGVPYEAAEILCETVFDGRGWRFGAARELDLTDPRPTTGHVVDASAFVEGSGGSRPDRQ